MVAVAISIEGDGCGGNDAGADHDGKGDDKVDKVLTAKTMEGRQCR